MRISGLVSDFMVSDNKQQEDNNYHSLSTINTKPYTEWIKKTTGSPNPIQLLWNQLQGGRVRELSDCVHTNFGGFSITAVLVCIIMKDFILHLYTQMQAGIYTGRCECS